MAAGTAVHDLLRIFFTYREAFAWKMQAGMGDTVFTPFYEVLKKRGVRFEFFHRVSKLGLSPDRSTVDTIDVIPQVRLMGGELRPARRGQGPRCPGRASPAGTRSWTATKLRDARRRTSSGIPIRSATSPRPCEQGEDFDLVVLGISVAALPAICEELIADADNPGFRTHDRELAHGDDPGLPALAEPPAAASSAGRSSDDSIMTAYVEPLDTYADMSHLIPREAWPAGENVENIAYFCGVHRGPAGRHPGDAPTTRARANAIDYLRRDARGIWPKSMNRDGTGFDWNLLAARRRPRPGAVRLAVLARELPAHRALRAHPGGQRPVPAGLGPVRLREPRSSPATG